MIYAQFPYATLHVDDTAVITNPKSLLHRFSATLISRLRRKAASIKKCWAISPGFIDYLWIKSSRRQNVI